MPTQYEIDTKLIELMISICLVMSIFSIGFVTVLSTSSAQSKATQSMQILFMMMFTLFLGTTAGLFIKWYRKYRTSLFGYFK
jgi:NADH:ubiquinone oxidoreductase subunit K